MIEVLEQGSLPTNVSEKEFEKEIEHIRLIATLILRKKGVTCLSKC